jgi:restriction system protein
MTPSGKIKGAKHSRQYQSEFLRFMNPLLDVLRDKGGQARPREIYGIVADRVNLSEEERAATLKSGGVRFQNQIAWARSYLTQTGYLDSPSHGIWRLTDKGLAAHLADPDIDGIFRQVQELKVLQKADAPDEVKRRPASSSPASDEIDDEDAIAPSPQTSPYSGHRPALLAMIAAMTPEGFEEFCAELLSRVGVEDVQTTRFTRDGGIDGTGRLRVNEFVTMPVAFQSKKFDGSGRKVSSEEIQRFRGAMDGNIAKGIFFTTTTFSDDAKREARRSGKVEVELVDLDRILEICEAYLIGLSEQKILVPEPIFFERFRKARESK